MPRAYYNEIDKANVAWLKELIAENLIAPGDVDDRDIRDVKPIDLAGYTQCHFFAGIGGWSLALRRAGVADHAPLWTGSCPCQPFSAAGRRGGFADERHLWPSFYHLITQCRPAKLYGEQVASAADWLRLVRGDLEAMDYAVGAMPIEAASAGADHLRDRFWFVGHANVSRSQGPRILPERADQCAAGTPSVADAIDGRCDRPRLSQFSRNDLSSATGTGGGERDRPEVEWVVGADGKARRVKSGIRLLVDRFPNRVGLLRGFGNAIDPRPAAAFIQAAMSIFHARPHPKT